MKHTITLIVGLIIVYLVFFNQGDQEPTQSDVQSLESIRDENGKLVEVPILETDGVPYPSISHGFKKLSRGGLSKPLNNLKKLLPNGPSILPIFRTTSENISKKRMYLPDYYRKDTMPMDNIGSEEMKPFVTNEEEPEAEAETELTEDVPAEEPEVETEAKPEVAEETQTEKIKTEE